MISASTRSVAKESRQPQQTQAWRPVGGWLLVLQPSSKLESFWYVSLRSVRALVVTDWSQTGQATIAWAAIPLGFVGYSAGAQI